MILLLLIVLGLVGLVIGTVSLISLHKEEVALTHRSSKASPEFLALGSDNESATEISGGAGAAQGSGFGI
jgi:hypothetical protein